MRDPFKVEGRITEALPNGTYRAELANGHRLLAFMTRRSSDRGTRFAPGDKVNLEISPFDLSKGRIVQEEI